MFSINGFTQGNTACTAVAIQSGTFTADGPSAGGGAINSCNFPGTVTATHADWYKYTAPASGYITISSCSGGANTRLSVYKGFCYINPITGVSQFGVSSCLASNDNACSYGFFDLGARASKIENFEVTGGKTYFIQWDDRWSTSGFTWSLSFTLSNDDCSQYIGIDIDGEVLQGSNAIATVENNYAVSCGKLNDLDTDADVWYSFIAPVNASGLIIETFNILNAPDNLSDSQLQIFNTCDPDEEALYCDDDSGEGAMSKISLEFGALNPGQQYFVQVDGWNTSGGVFGISIVSIPFTAPANDLCANATPLTVNEFGNCAGNEIVGTLIGAGSDDLGCQPENIDVFYSFNCGADTAMTINLAELGADIDLGISVYEENCAGEQVYCFFNSAANTFAVLPNTNYIVQVQVNLYNSSPGDFSICITPAKLATINGTVPGWSSNCAEREVKLYLLNTANYQIYYATTTLSTSGTYAISSLIIPVGTYHILVQVKGALAVLNEDVVLSVGANNFTSAPVIRGDINSDNAINFLDISAFSAAYGKASGTPGYNFLADLNCDGVINVFDVSILSAGFNQVGDNILI